MPKIFQRLLFFIILISTFIKAREKTDFLTLSEKKYSLVKKNIQKTVNASAVPGRNSQNVFKISKDLIFFLGRSQKNSGYMHSVNPAKQFLICFVNIKKTVGIFLIAKAFQLAEKSSESIDDFENEAFSEKTIHILNRKNTKVNIAKNMVIIALCSTLIGSFFHFRTIQRRQRSKLRHIIRNQYQLTSRNPEFVWADVDHSFPNISIEEVSAAEKLVKRRNESLMTSETETKLLDLLSDFEKGTLYNSKNMSLPFLAGELNTNTKYLSHIINRHKSSDFKTYINRLRVNYMINKLENEEKYRQYKISILADECGFSSHSKFASVFKNVTAYSPSAYIKLLDSGNQTHTKG